MFVKRVKLNDPIMLMCYRMAKDLYEVNKWNEKAVPVCAIVRKGKVLSYGIGGNGMHQLTGVCKRAGKDNSPYSDCPYCTGYEHAEQYALRRLTQDATGASMYMYGNYRACPECEQSMRGFGIHELVILEGSSWMFDRHSKRTVIGKPSQFKK